jgi:SMP-30/Gluconolactonase/LRE-like region
MRHVAWGLALAWSAMKVGHASAQLPASGKLSESDGVAFRAEVARVEKMLDSAPDKATVTYEIARTWAAGKQWPEAVEWLRKAVDSRAGFDPSRERLFAELRGSHEFAAIEAAALAATPPVSHSQVAFQVAEGDLAPESMAFDPRGRRFYFGSMRKGKVLRCSVTGECETFVEGLGVVLGMKVFGGGLWVLSNVEKESALVHFELASGRLLRRYAASGPHNFNDLVFAGSGDVYLTDTRAGAVWKLQHGGSELTRISGEFGHANGIAVSGDGRLLYVSTFPEGLTVVDLKTNEDRAVARPGDLCLATVDGLYFYRGALIAIQNAFMAPRVVRLRLRKDLRGIEGFEVLERRNPLFDGVTTGVIVGNELFYMANIQDEKQSGFQPITVLKMAL